MRLLVFWCVAQNLVVFFMFYNKYVNYCIKAGIAPTTAAEEMGFSRSDATRWSKGSTPRRSTLERVASYFSAKLNLSLSYKEFENGPESPQEPASHTVNDLAGSVAIAMYDGDAYSEVPDDIKNLAAAFALAKSEQEIKDPALRKIVDICKANPEYIQPLSVMLDQLVETVEKSRNAAPKNNK